MCLIVRRMRGFLCVLTFSRLVVCMYYAIFPSNLAYCYDQLFLYSRAEFFLLRIALRLRVQRHCRAAAACRTLHKVRNISHDFFSTRQWVSSRHSRSGDQITYNINHACQLAHHLQFSRRLERISS